MKQNGIYKVVKNLGGVLNKNSPTILTGLAVGGVVTTVIFAVKTTPKAIDILEEAKDQKFPLDESEDDTQETISKKEIIQLTWKLYIPTIFMGAATIACIIGSNSINRRRNAALASVYGLTEAAFREYKDKVVETIGKNKELKVRDEINHDKINQNPVSKSEVIFTGKGDVLCYDSYSGRYFKSDIEKIRQSINDLNQERLSSMWISLNDLYYALGLAETKLGDRLGWDLDKELQVSFSSQVAENGEPCLVLNYTAEPRFEE